MNENNAFLKNILEKINKSSAKHYHHKTISQIKTPKSQFFLLFTPMKQVSKYDSKNSEQRKIKDLSLHKSSNLITTVRKESRKQVSPFQIFSNERKIVPLLYRNFYKDEESEKNLIQSKNIQKKHVSISNLLWDESKNKNWKQKIEDEASEVNKV